LVSNVTEKKWYKSKLLWFNFLVGIAAACEASFSIVQGYFEPRIYFGLVCLVSGINMVLRFISNSKLIK
jgi:hypothetical protein